MVAVLPSKRSGDYVANTDTNAMQNKHRPNDDGGEN